MLHYKTTILHNEIIIFHYEAGLLLMLHQMPNIVLMLYHEALVTSMLHLQKLFEINLKIKNN